VVGAAGIRYVADEIEKKLKEGVPSMNAIRSVIAQTLKNHRRIIFGGNGYSKEWVEEARIRGLENLKECVAAIQKFDSPKNIELFNSLGVLSPKELLARKNIYLEHYAHTVNIEAQLTQNLVQTHVIPAALKYQESLARSVLATRKAAPKSDLSAQEEILEVVSRNISGVLRHNKQLAEVLKESHDNHDPEKLAIFFRDSVKPVAKKVREFADSLEGLVADELWTLPKYSEILFIK